jgi:hypothetical protein
MPLKRKVAPAIRRHSNMLPVSQAHGETDLVCLTTTATSITPVNSATERNATMATSNKGANGHHCEPEAFDPLLEAEALRAALQEAMNRVTRLMGGLRQFRKQHKAVANAMASLRQIQFAP